MPYKDPLEQKACKDRVLERNQAYVADYLRFHWCVDCGESDMRVLEFDHLKDKTKNVTTFMGSNARLKRIKEEISKCEVVCANCHNIRSHTRRGWNWRETYRS